MDATERDDDPPAHPMRGAGPGSGSHHDLPIDPDLAPDDPGEPSVAHRPTHRPRHREPRELVAIGIGGFLGTAARYGVDLAWPTAHDAFPAATFAINTSGAFALGLILTLILGRGAATGHLRAFACVGLLGAWTTMSTLAAEADGLGRAGDLPLALSYVAASLAAGLVAVAAGIALGRRTWASS